VLLVALGAVIYVACCLWRAPENRLEIGGAIGRRREGRAPRVETLEAGL
jgi:hypothetical protein